MTEGHVNGGSNERRNERRKEETREARNEGPKEPETNKPTNERKNEQTKKHRRTLRTWKPPRTHKLHPNERPAALDLPTSAERRGRPWPHSAAPTSHLVPTDRTTEKPATPTQKRTRHTHTHTPEPGREERSIGVEWTGVESTGVEAGTRITRKTNKQQKTQ